LRGEAIYFKYIFATIQRFIMFFVAAGFGLHELGIAPITAQAKVCDYKYFCLTVCILSAIGLKFATTPIQHKIAE
jgi:hypothetical protein